MMADKTPREAVDQLVGILNLGTTGEDSFASQPTPAGAESGAGRVFGGQVIAQALRAAEATAPDGRPANSFHAYFLRMGDDSKPIAYDVSRDLDGGSFANRRVTARQEDRLLLSLTASFHRREDGLHHQEPMPDVPPPEALRSDYEMRLEKLHLYPERIRARFGSPGPFDQHPVEDVDWIDTPVAPPLLHNWFRLAAPIGDDQGLHRAILAYMSDLTLMRTGMLPHGLSWFRDKMQDASLDHAMWFHDDFRADDWLLFRNFSPWTGRVRSLNQGQVYTRDGRLVATVIQEGLVRVIERGGRG